MLVKWIILILTLASLATAEGRNYSADDLRRLIKGQSLMKSVVKRAVGAPAGATCKTSDVLNREICTWYQLGSTTTSRECTEAHNIVRQLHGAPNMTWSTTLATASANWAYGLLENNTSNHSKTSAGENIYKSWWNNAELDCADAVYDWYSEVLYPDIIGTVSNYDYNSQTKALYDYNSNTPPSETGHFTQVAWKSSTEVGCGVVSSAYKKDFPQADGSSYTFDVTDHVIVCQYSPAGNSDGQYLTNILKPASDVFGNIVKTPYDLEVEGKCFDKLLGCSSGSCGSSATFCPSVCNPDCAASGSSSGGYISDGSTSSGSTSGGSTSGGSTSGGSTNEGSATSSSSDCKTSVVGADYAGNISHTTTGKACVDWSGHNYGIQGTACRNPDSDGLGPWCFVAGGVYEYCNIPLCSV